MTTGKPIRPRKGHRALPRFRSVEAESAFWDTHSFLDFGDWEVVSYEEALRDLASRKEPKLPVTLRLERGLIQKLKQVARRHGVKYQSLVREILRRSLAKSSE
jgi:predicted DNA binding CopG/RHH family protein